MAYAIALSAFAYVPARVSAGSTPPQERFLREAPQSWEAYRAFAARLQGTHLHKTFAGSLPEGAFRDGVRYDLKQSGMLTASVSEELGDDRSRRGAAIRARVVNSRYAFVLERAAQGGEWVLTELDLDLKDRSPIDPVARKKSVVDAFCPHFAIRSRSLSEVLNESGFHLNSAASVVQNGREFVRVNFVHHHETGEHQQLWTRIEGWVLLDPDRFWAVKEGHLTARHLGDVFSTLKIENLYEENEDGIPIPQRRMLRTRYESLGAVREEVTVSEYEISWAGEPPESDFTLTAFGLPEPPGVNWRRPPTYWLFASIAGIVMLILGSALAWLRRRSA